MLRHIKKQEMGGSDLGWLKSIFHFSFAEYQNPNNINFGVLRVVNDDLVAPKTGFDTHPHRDMEIISYVVDGTLTHSDSLKNERTLSKGHVQYMSAGTGVEHSEHNLGETTSRFIQLWIYPDEKGHSPKYGDHAFNWEDRQNRWLHMVSSQNGNAPIKINQDANVYVTEITEGQSLDLNIQRDRQAYMVLIEGIATANGIYMNEKDAMEMTEASIKLSAEKSAHIMVIEMERSKR